MERSTKTFTRAPHFFPRNNDNPLLKDEDQGKASSHEFSNNFCYQEYNIKAKEDEHIKVSLTNKEGFLFLYCWKGNLSIRLNKVSKVISPYQSVLLYNKNAEEIIVDLEKQHANQFCVIGFSKPGTGEHISKNLFYDRFKEPFLNQLYDANYIYIGQPYLKLLEKINSLSRMSKDNWVSELIMQGLILQVLGLKMEQILEAFSVEQKQHRYLTHSEIERLNSISDFIKENPALEFSVDFLCRETGISPSKLQKGFKSIHNRTVIDYIRHVRLEKSLELIRNSDLNISEIVYSIGLTSRSYFSKIFKNKYKCCPKQFQDQQRLAN